MPIAFFAGRISPEISWSISYLNVITVACAK
jgi:hypothetical protein